MSVNAKMGTVCAVLLSCWLFLLCRLLLVAGITLSGPPRICRTLCIHSPSPIFKNKTQFYHTEVPMTQAVVREFTDRRRLTVTPDGR